MPSTSEALLKHKSVAGAFCIFAKLRDPLVSQLYKPSPAAAPFVGAMDAIEELLDDVIPNIPDESRGNVLTQVLACCVEVLDSRFRAWCACNLSNIICSSRFRFLIKHCCEGTHDIVVAKVES
eukprot:SAG31_NODE_1162_length_9594_cov_3.045498_6_plen_123_part_00